MQASLPTNLPISVGFSGQKAIFTQAALAFAAIPRTEARTCTGISCGLKTVHCTVLTHLICICWRSDVTSIPGTLKANMEILITSHCADKESSTIILDNGDAAALPKISGRFLSSDGTEFQAYNFSTPPCDTIQEN